MSNLNKHKIIEEYFREWISAYPTSKHPLDEERFHKFAKAAVKYDENAEKYNETWLRESLEESKKFDYEFIREYMRKFNTIRDYSKVNID